MLAAEAGRGRVDNAATEAAADVVIKRLLDISPLGPLVVELMDVLLSLDGFVFTSLKSRLQHASLSKNSPVQGQNQGGPEARLPDLPAGMVQNEETQSNEVVEDWATAWARLAATP